MRISIQRDLGGLVETARLAKRIGAEPFRKQMARGVIDAGRKSKTVVQKAAMKQANFKAGSYGHNVVAQTRQRNDEAALSATIFAIRGGQPVQEYAGLRVLKRRPAATDGELAGAVSSGVWSNPRVFKRSFESGGGFFALLPAGTGSGKAPRALWTFGKKPEQPRDGGGRFASRGIRYGAIRRLAGPSLREELGQGDTAATFERQAPEFLEEAVTRRLDRILKF